MDRIERIRQSFITRKTEENDTHSYIQRHDPDHHKGKSSKKDGSSSFDDDMADISVESLVIFLKGLLKEDESPHGKNNKKPIDQTMQSAINAYQKKPLPTKRRYTYLDDDHQDIDPAHVHTLIESLETLLNDGIDHINLIQADGFLISIEKTVEKYQSL